MLRNCHLDWAPFLSLKIELEGEPSCPFSPLCPFRPVVPFPFHLTPPPRLSAPLFFSNRKKHKLRCPSLSTLSLSVLSLSFANCLFAIRTIARKNFAAVYCPVLAVVVDGGVEENCALFSSLFANVPDERSCQYISLSHLSFLPLFSDSVALPSFPSTTFCHLLSPSVTFCHLRPFFSYWSF